MLRRVLLLVLIMAVPVLTALGTQQLARTTMPPTLPSDPVSTRVTAPSSPDPETSAPAPTTEPEATEDPAPADDREQQQAPTSGPVAPVDEEEHDDEDDPDLEPEDDDGPDEVDLDTDSDGEQDDVPEAGTVTR